MVGRIRRAAVNSTLRFEIVQKSKSALYGNSEVKEEFLIKLKSFFGLVGGLLSLKSFT